MNSFIEIMRKILSPIPLLANRTAYKGGECVIYDVTTLSYDKLKRSVRVKLTIVTEKSDTRAQEIEQMLDEALVTFGDNPLTETVTSCERNSGGWMSDNDRFIRIAYYQVTIRGGN